MLIRKMVADDAERGFYDVLSNLSDVTPLNTDQTNNIMSKRQRQGITTFVAIEDNKVVGTASVFIEDKFTHGGYRVAHIEDVVVSNSRKERGLGTMLVNAIIRSCVDNKCNRIILSCNEEVVGFYKKLDFYEHGVEMRLELH